MVRLTHNQEIQLMALMVVRILVQATPLTGQMVAHPPAQEIQHTILTAQALLVQVTLLTARTVQVVLVLAIQFIVIKLQKLSPNPSIKRDALKRAPCILPITQK